MSRTCMPRANVQAVTQLPTGLWLAFMSESSCHLRNADRRERRCRPGRRDRRCMLGHVLQLWHAMQIRETSYGF
jgi:hypothetical protein